MVGGIHTSEDSNKFRLWRLSFINWAIKGIVSRRFVQICIVIYTSILLRLRGNTILHLFYIYVLNHSHPRPLAVIFTCYMHPSANVFFSAFQVKCKNQMMEWTLCRKWLSVMIIRYCRCTGGGSHVGAGGCNKCMHAKRTCKTCNKFDCLVAPAKAKDVCKDNNLTNYYTTSGNSQVEQFVRFLHWFFNLLRHHIV